MQGISTIITIILIVVIVITLVSLLYLFSSNLITSTTAVGDVSIENVKNRTKGCLRIENVDEKNGNITLRNCGYVPLSDFKVYVNDVEKASDPGTLEPGSILTVNLELGGGTYDIFASSNNAESLHKFGEIIGNMIFVYQENADETTCSDNFCDGNWNTFVACGNEYYINYTKPLNAINATWQIKEDLYGTTNISIINSCWNFDINKIMLRVSQGGSGTSHWECFDGVWEGLLDTTDSTIYYEEAILWKKS